MRKIRELLRLRYGLEKSLDEIAASCSVGKTTVHSYLARAKKAGLSWPLPDDLDDGELEALLYPRSLARLPKETTPDWAQVHAELRRPGVTRQILWQEYVERDKDGVSYSRFCELYQTWLKRSRLTMRQVHRAGEKLFVDFAGTGIAVFDPKTGESRRAEIFVATWGASNFTYAEAVWSQKLETWIQCHVRAVGFFGCVPKIVVPDNLRSGVTQACRYDPDVNETYSELARHYGFAVIPARAGRPKDKAKVEFGVLLVTRWIVAALRNRRFFSLDELNEAIMALIDRLNEKPFQKLPGSRKSAFSELDRPCAQALPPTPYVYAEILKARVNIDYHVAVDDHFYSVPHQLVGEKITTRLTATAVEILHKNRRVASHRRSQAKWQHTTTREHMPKSHRAHLEWTPSRIIDWAAKTGAATAELVTEIIKSRPHPEQGYRAALGIIRLGDRFGKERLEAACARAVSFKAFRFRYVKSILERGLDGQGAGAVDARELKVMHANIRGSDYYRIDHGDNGANERDAVETERHEALRDGEGLQRDALEPGAGGGLA